MIEADLRSPKFTKYRIHLSKFNVFATKIAEFGVRAARSLARTTLMADLVTDVK